MTTNEWYEEIASSERLLQGDIIRDCPLLAWKDGAEPALDIGNPEILESQVTAKKADVIVMTQACDLEQNRVQNVIFCPHYTLDEYKTSWEERSKSKGRTINIKDWRKHCETIEKGFHWNLFMLNEGETTNLKISHRIVDFSDIYTIPRIWIEHLLANRNEPRSRLLPPYREHLSQSFARYFMRVGLPTNVNPVWKNPK